jgi:hypothetical protein
MPTKANISPVARIHLKNVLRSIDWNLKAVPKEWRQWVIQKIEAKLIEWRQKPE